MAKKTALKKKKKMFNKQFLVCITGSLRVKLAGVPQLPRINRLSDCGDTQVLRTKKKKRVFPCLYFNTKCP